MPEEVKKIHLWGMLMENELETVKQLIFEQQKEAPKMPYIRAAGMFRDERTISILMNLINEYTTRFIDEKLLSAKVLHDWIDYENYILMLKSACRNHNDIGLHSYLKYFINQFVDGLSEKDKVQVMKALKCEA